MNICLYVSVEKREGNILILCPVHMIELTNKVALNCDELVTPTLSCIRKVVIDDTYDGFSIVF